MPFELFFLWRGLLCAVVGSYCLVVTADRVIGLWWMVHGKERYWGYTRKYLVIQLLRVSWRDVRWELMQIAFWLVALAALVGGHIWLPTG